MMKEITCAIFDKRLFSSTEIMDGARKGIKRMTAEQTYTIRDAYFWKITCSLALASFFVFAAMYAVQPLLPVFVHAFGVSVSTSSLALSFTILGLIAGLIILGFLSDRWGRTRLIKISLLIAIIPFLLIPLSDSFFWLISLRFLQGFALAGLPAASLAYISEEMDTKSVGAATGIYIASNALGGMIGRVMTGYLTDHFSWQTAFYVLSFIGLIIWLLVLFMLPSSRFFKPSNLSFKKDLAGFFYHVKNPLLLPIFGLGIVLQFSFTGVWTYLPFHLQAAPYYLSIEFISYLFLAYGFGVVGSPLAGWLAGTYGLKKMRILGIVVLSVGILLTLIQSLLFIIIGLCIACAGFFTAHSLTATSVSETATHHKGSASSLYLVAYYIGVSSGSTFMAPIWERFGWSGMILLTGSLPVLYTIFIQVFQARKKGNIHLT